LQVVGDVDVMRVTMHSVENVQFRYCWKKAKKIDKKTCNQKEKGRKKIFSIT
jgi:hypothetical protein